MNLNFFIIILGLVILIGLSFHFAHAQQIVPGYSATGIETAVNTSLTKVINMNQAKELSLLINVDTGNLGSGLMNVSVSANGLNFTQIDSLNMGATANFAKIYSDTNKGTGLAINPSVFPFVKIVTPQIINVTQTLTYSGIR